MTASKHLPKRPLFYYGFTLVAAEGRLWAPAVVHRYIRSLGVICERPVVVTPIDRRSKAPSDWEPCEIPRNMDTLEIDAFESMVGGVWTKRSLDPAMLTGLDEVDLVLARYPDHYWRVLHAEAARRGVPFKLHFVGDPISLNGAIWRRSRGVSRARTAAKIGVWAIDRLRLRRSLGEGDVVASNGADAVATYFPERLDSAQIVVSSSVEQHEILQREVLCDSPIRAVFVGIDRPEKRLDITLDAVEELGDAFRLEVIGPTGRSGAPANVSFLGPLGRQDLFEVLDRSDVLVVSSESEGTPRVILEAMARGVLVVASDAGGIPDSLDHGRRGVMFQSTSVASLVAALEWVDSNRVLAQNLATCGAAYAASNTVTDFLRELLSIPTEGSS